MGNHLATTDMDQKLGGEAVPLFWRGAGSPSNTMWPRLRPTSVPSAILIHPAIWPQWTWADNWELCPFFGGRGAGFPSNAMSPGPRPTFVPIAFSPLLLSCRVSPHFDWYSLPIPLTVAWNLMRFSAQIRLYQRRSTEVRRLS